MRDIGDDEPPMGQSESERIIAENKSFLARLSERKMVLVILLFTNACQLFVNLTLIWAVLYHFPVKQFLWTSDARSVCTAIPLSEPDISAARVSNFVASAAVDLHSYDYLNWHRMLTNAMEKYLTPRERVQFEGNIQQIIKIIQDGNITLTAIVTGRPHIDEEGVRAVDHRYYWRVSVPVELFYYNGTERKPENRVMTMTVVRVDPSPENPNGIAIDDFVSVQSVDQSGAQGLE